MSIRSGIDRSGVLKLFWKETREISRFGGELLLLILCFGQGTVCIVAIELTALFLCIDFQPYWSVSFIWGQRHLCSPQRRQVSASDTHGPIGSAFSWRLTSNLPFVACNKKMSFWLKAHCNYKVLINLLVILRVRHSQPSFKGDLGEMSVPGGVSLLLWGGREVSLPEHKQCPWQKKVKKECIATTPAVDYSLSWSLYLISIIFYVMT